MTHDVTFTTKSALARFALVFCSLTALLGCSAHREPADLLLTGAKVYTVDAARPWAEAVAVRDGRIVAVGDTADLTKRYDAAQVLKLDGDMLLPGFHDSHVHPIGAGIDLSQCDLTDEQTVEAIIAKVGQCRDAQPGTDWIVGSGWNLSLFPEANPRKELLDAVSIDRPIVLAGADGHSTWVNSKALAAAHIDKSTPNPPKGVIERDPKTGEPSGTLRESAQGLVRAVVPAPSQGMREAGLQRALEVLNGFGITSMIDAALDPENIAIYRAADEQGKLTMRVVGCLVDGTPNLEALVQPADRGTHKRLRLDAVKFFVDGVLEGETAALLEPYLDSGVKGDLKYAPADLAARVTALDAKGIQVHMHTIGDAAVREGLDAIAAARAANGPSDNRHHIAHLQLVDPADYPRFAELDVTANFQALWAFPDSYIMDVNLPVVGQARVDRMYPIGSLLRAHARIAGGSDWFVSSPNPLLAIQVAVTRQDPEGKSTGVLNANEAVPLATMIEAYTKNGAFLMHQEQDVGTIEVGKLADLVVLDRNLFDIPPNEIGKAKVVMTLLEGKKIYPR